MIVRCIFVYGAFLLAALMTTACSKEPVGAPEPGEALPVRFEVPGIEQTVGATKAAEALAEGTTVRIAAFYKSASNPSPANLCQEVTYCLRDGKLVPCLVDENGAFTEFGGQDMELLPFVYDFYAVSPALPLGDDKGTVNVPQGVDFATSVTADCTISGEKVQTLTLATLNRRCAKVTFKVKRADDFAAMTALSVRKLTVGGLQPTASNAAPIDGPIPAAVGSNAFVLPAEAFTASDATTSSATTFLLPTTGAGRITLDFELEWTLNGAKVSQTVNNSVASLKLEAGKSYTVTLTVEKHGVSIINNMWDNVDQPTDVGGW